MAHLLLDPPAPRLRLITGDLASQPSAREHRLRDAATLGAAARRCYRAVLAWALEQPRAVNPDAVRVLLAVRQTTQFGPINRFTVDDIWRLIMVDVVAWCRSRRLSVPEGCPAALLVILDALEDLGELHPQSDDLATLALALQECSGQALQDLEHC
ncbi:MAG: hypothetical protein AAF567_10825 [Actinomycetota bacterium]